MNGQPKKDRGHVSAERPGQVAQPDSSDRPGNQKEDTDGREPDDPLHQDHQGFESCIKELTGDAGSLASRGERQTETDRKDDDSKWASCTHFMDDVRGNELIQDVGPGAAHGLIVDLGLQICIG